jgi:hypothetical protein
MKEMLLGCALAGLLLSPAAQAQDAALFRPNSAWAADYGDDYCRLVRSFSDGKDEINLAIQRVQPGADTQVLLIGDAIRPFRGAEELGWHFLPSDAERKSRYTRSQTGDGQQYLRIENVMLTPFTPPPPGTPPGPPPYDRTAEQTAGKTMTGLLVSTGVTKPVRIETGRLDAPIAALQTCTDDLIKTWGLDPEKHKTMSAPARLNPNPDGILPQGTIPFGDFAKFAGGGNQVRLMLDAGGKPTSCTVFSPTLDGALNDRICQLVMEKASFTPAKDAAGQPMASYWMGSPMFLGPPMAMRGRR